jgi:hypothetical protein
VALRSLEGLGSEQDDDDLEGKELSCEEIAKIYRRNCRSKTQAGRNGIIHDAQICGMLRTSGSVDLLKAGDFEGVDKNVYAHFSRSK